eukprot:6207642-Pleurochrysis_carterae.AAC.2
MDSGKEKLGQRMDEYRQETNEAIMMQRSCGGPRASPRKCRSSSVSIGPPAALHTRAHRRGTQAHKRTRLAPQSWLGESRALARSFLLPGYVPLQMESVQTDAEQRASPIRRRQ